MNVAGRVRQPARSPVGKGRQNTKREGEFELNFYAEPPNCELSLDEFEMYALARLKVRKDHIPIFVNEVHFTHLSLYPTTTITYRFSGHWKN